MIHIVEINEQNRAHAWFAFDEADFIRKVRVDHGQRPETVIYEKTTARQLLSSSPAADATQNRDKLPNCDALAEQHGWDTTLYRADHLLGHGIYQTEPVSELRACLAAVASAVEFRIYGDDDTAADELDRDPLYRTKEGLDAYFKLRSQLVEMEVLAEDF